MTFPVAYDAGISTSFPELTAGMLIVDGIDHLPPCVSAIARLHAVASKRLATCDESGFPEIQAWRRAFSTMGLRPTQYRCASEALLRRYRKEGGLPRIHPLVDLCNAASLASGIPVAAFDKDRLAGQVTVREATGTEVYVSFAGRFESPAPGETIFADEANRAHSRRWTNRQSGFSAVRTSTTTAVLVMEALHQDAEKDLKGLLTDLSSTLNAALGEPLIAMIWSARSAVPPLAV